MNNDEDKILINMALKNLKGQSQIDFIFDVLDNAISKAKQEEIIKLKEILKTKKKWVWCYWKFTTILNQRLEKLKTKV